MKVDHGFNPKFQKKKWWVMVVIRMIKPPFFEIRKRIQGRPVCEMNIFFRILSADFFPCFMIS